jgi:hypothetical protein
MTNHFHLYFRTPQPNLSRGAQFLLGNYAQQFNRRHRRSGHVFEGRFRCQVIENESYAWTVSRYVHLNPVPAIVEHPADWPWSSYAGYRDPELRLPWVCYNDLLHAWSNEFGGEAADYCEFVERGITGDRGDPFVDATDGWILGSDAFASRVRQLVSPESNEPDAIRARRSTFSLSDILDACCEEFAVSPAELRRKGSRHPARSIVAQLGRVESDAKLREIAAALGLARRDCVPSLARRAANDSTLSESIKRIQRRLVKAATHQQNAIILE